MASKIAENAIEEIRSRRSYKLKDTMGDCSPFLSPPFDSKNYPRMEPSSLRTTMKDAFGLGTLISRKKGKFRRS